MLRGPLRTGQCQGADAGAARRACQAAHRSVSAIRSVVAPFSLHECSAGYSRTPAPPQAHDQYGVVHNNQHNDAASVLEHQEQSPDVHNQRQRHVSHGRPCVLGSSPGLLAGSHTQPANSKIAAHGCYRVIGPARISKRGECLVARLLPGSRLELLSDGGCCVSAVEAVEDTPSSTSSPASAAPALPLHPPSASVAVAATNGAGTDGSVVATHWADLDAAATQRTVLDAAQAPAHPWEEGGDLECVCAGDGCGLVACEDAELQDGSTASCGSGSWGEDDDDEGDGAVAECVLVAAYVELGGSASSVDVCDMALQPAMHHHNGHTYLSVRNLPDSAVISLSADGDLSHPVNVTPGPPPE